MTLETTERKAKMVIDIPVQYIYSIYTCFRMKKDRATFFRSETIVASFLHLMVLFFKVLLNHTLVLHIKIIA